MKIISTIANGPGEIFLKISTTEKVVGMIFIIMLFIIMVLLIFYLRKKVFE